MAQKQRAVGGCACGRLRFELTVAPIFVHACHCTWCQAESGEPFVVNAQVETDCLELLSGAPEFIIIPTKSGNGQALAHCPACRSVVWSHYSPGPELMFLRVASLDDPSLLAPQAHIFTRSRQAHIKTDPATPSFDGFYDRSTLWSAAALARRHAVEN